MNKVLIATVLACGLLLLESPEAAAHEGKGDQYRHVDRDLSSAYRRDAHSRDYYGRNTYRGERYDTRHKRAGRMPKWLEKDRSFRRWLKRTGLQKSRHISWHQLFDIYRWERSNYRYHRH